jgi:hypothetical protein
MIAAQAKVDDFVLNIEEEIHVKAPMDVTFEALIEQLEDMSGGDGRPMPMKIEQWPGGRWYRDLGNNSGHHWAHVQSIKKPTLLEFYGPLMMSYPVTSNVQYRLSEEPGGTLIKFQHKGFGAIPEDFRKGVREGWGNINKKIRERAEKAKK